MKQNRCSLCGGRLVHNRCVLCGLDNSKSDKRYKLNQNSCDNMPLTHVHLPKETKQADNRTENETNKKKETKDEWLEAAERSRAAAAARRMRPEPVRYGQTKVFAAVGIFAVFFIAFLVLGREEKDPYSEWNMVGSAAVDIGNGIYAEEEEPEVLDEDGLTGEGIFEGMYDFVPYDLPETGAHYETEIEADINDGDQLEIIVGEDKLLPEGTYRVDWVSGEGCLVLDDEDSLIYFYQYFTEDEMGLTGSRTLADLRLYKGAKVQLEPDDENFVLRFTAENTAEKKKAE